MASNDLPTDPASSPPDKVVIYTDGGCKGNPGPGGWGALLRFKDAEREVFGSDPATTNNRMELMAAIGALESLKRPCQVELHTDSQYLRNGITQWIFGWKRNGWKTADKKPVKNADLWQRLDAARTAHSVSWLWVKGHDGDEGNERAHILAQLGIEEAIRSA